MEKIQKKQQENQGKPDYNQKDRTISTSKEIGGPKGLEPTRYGDWERKGRCIDF
jgi:hypothetical protein